MKKLLGISVLLLVVSVDFFYILKENLFFLMSRINFSNNVKYRGMGTPFAEGVLF